LTKLKPEFSYIQFSENYDINLESDVIFVADVAKDLILISDSQQLIFNETGSVNNSHHGHENIDDMMEIDGQAGNLYGKQKINESFELTSAEFHLKTYYGLKNSNSDKIYCIVSADSLNLGILCFSLSPDQTIGKLRSLIDCQDQHKDLYLMTKVKQRRYSPKKTLSEFALTNGCIFFRFQNPEKL